MRRIFTGLLLVVAVMAGCGSEGDSAGEGRDGQQASAAREARQQAKRQAAARRAAKRARAVRRAAAQARRRAARRKEARQAARQRARQQAQAEAEEAEAAPEEECDPNYSGACLDPYASDYDCEGGSGDGPAYTGPVVVVGEDRHGLDSDSDGEGCETY